MTEQIKGYSIKVRNKPQLFCHYHDEYFDNKAQAIAHQIGSKCQIAREVELV